MKNKKTVDCPIHKTEMPASICIARQKILAEASADGNKGEAYKIYRKSCGRCKIGLELYRLEKLKTEASTKGKPVQAKSSLESKICPCGKEFNRQPDQGNASWSRAKYCLECANLTQYQRIKKFAQEPEVESVKLKDDAVDSNTEEQSGEYKICAREGCGIVFYREDTPAAAWQLKKYCCHECKKTAERAREKARKKLKRKRVAVASDFDHENAEMIAMAVAEESLKLISMFVTSSAHLEQMRALAVKVGIESQKAAHDAVWG